MPPELDDIEQPEVEAAEEVVEEEAVVEGESGDDLDALFNEILDSYGEGESQEGDDTPDGPGPGELSEDVEEEEVPEVDAEEETSEEISEAPEPEPEGPSEVELLKAELAQLKAQLAQPKREEPKQDRASGTDRADFETAVHILLHGGEKSQETWTTIPARIKKDAVDFVRGHTRAEVRYALDPKQRFNDMFKPFVEELLQSRLAPLYQEYQSRKVNEMMKPYQDKLSDPATKKRFNEILSGLPGVNTVTNLTEQKKLVSLAMEKLEWEKKAAELEARSQKVEAVERQQKVNRKARVRSAGKSRKVAAAPLPDLGEHESLEEYYNKLIANPGRYGLDD